MSSLLIWTDEDRINWARSWHEPHMEKGLLMLKLSCVPKGDPTPVVPGVDMRELASQAHAHGEGRASMFKEIADLMPQMKPKDIGRPFVRGTPPPRPEDETTRPEPKA